MCGDLHANLLSEVPWSSLGNEKFLFDNERICMVYNAGELSLIEYGKNEVLGTCRTEHISPYLISVRLGKTSKILMVLQNQDSLCEETPN